MLRLSELRLDLDHTEEDLEQAVLRCLRVPRERLISQHLVKRSIDARRRDRIRLIYSVDVNVRGEKALLRRRASDRRIRPAPDERYRFVARASSLQEGEDPARPVVIGAGPCGYFAALLLAQMGFRPLLLERGQPVKQRSLDTFGFWRRTSDFQPESNAQFGEGGAGTFSDGKLYSQVSDPVHYGRKVLEELVECGANRDILTLHRPHIGTFKLATVVRGLRAKIEALGGEVRFGARVERLLLEPSGSDHGKPWRIRALQMADGSEVACAQVVLAPGHSARDTFAMLEETGVALERKPFAIGVRIEHPQSLIDRARWGDCAGHPLLGAAEYKLVHHASNGRCVYSFCMCPGGFVGATSEEGRVVTNGMSQHSRNDAMPTAVWWSTSNPMTWLPMNVIPATPLPVWLCSGIWSSGPSSAGVEPMPPQRNGSRIFWQVVRPRRWGRLPRHISPASRRRTWLRCCRNRSSPPCAKHCRSSPAASRAMTIPMPC